MNDKLLGDRLQKADFVLPIPLAKSGVPSALVINLDSEIEEVVEISQKYLNKYVGGPALAARLWAEYYSDDSNPIIITGESTGSLVTVAFKSPVTENLTFNTFSGKLKRECCAIIVTGSLKRLSIISNIGNGLQIRHESRLSNYTASELSEFYPGCLCTGKAAENRLVFASAVCNGCISGRGGLGYVMAEKNIKALCLDILPTVRDTFDFSTFVKNSAIQGWAPVDNISKRTDPRLFHLCTSEKKRKLGDVEISCQAILMLGSNIGCYDITFVYERYKLCLQNGVDPVSVGNILGWIREAQDRGIIAFRNGVDFKDNASVLSLIQSLVDKTDGCDVFAAGIKEAAEYFGNTKFVKEINGLECGPYDYRGTHANALNDALGNWFPTYFDLVPDLKIKDKVDLAIYNEELVMGLQCLNINPDVVIPMMVNKLNVLKKFLISKNIIGLNQLFNSEELNITDVFTVGQNCRFIVREINRTLKNNPACIPDFFCVDPDSNSDENSIVNLRFLLRDYRRKIHK